MKEKNLNALVPEKLYKELKIQLLKEDRNYKDWLINQIEEYIDGNIEAKRIYAHQKAK